jgi:leucine dehydrogenase
VFRRVSSSSFFEQIIEFGHEQVVICHEPTSGLRAIIAVHDTTLGPSLGGIRQWDYASDAEALRDVLRLSRAMTYKAAVSGLDQGGGKSVVIGRPGEGGEARFRALGRYIDTLGGRYIGAEDVGTSPREMDWISRETPWVTGVDPGVGGSGDPSPLTAIGVYEGMRAACTHRYGSPELAGKKVVVQGCGHVGAPLVRLLLEAGAEVEVGDLHPERTEPVDALGARAVPLEGILARPCDIVAPCALGAAINRQTIPELRCDIVCGAANNQLEDLECGELLRERGILYAPDYVVNAGGIINIAEEFIGYDPVRAEARVRRVYDTTLAVLRRADEAGITPALAADRLAEERIAAQRPISSIFRHGDRTAFNHAPDGLLRRRR